MSSEEIEAAFQFAKDHYPANVEPRIVTTGDGHKTVAYVGISIYESHAIKNMLAEKQEVETQLETLSKTDQKPISTELKAHREKIDDALNPSIKPPTSISDGTAPDTTPENKPSTSNRTMTRKS